MFICCTFKNVDIIGRLPLHFVNIGWDDCFIDLEEYLLAFGFVEGSIFIYSNSDPSFKFTNYNMKWVK